MKYPVNVNNKSLAKEMRKQVNLTKAEWLVWNLILKNKKSWVKFLRQKTIWNYILDFYCPQLKLCIEIDDNSHDWKYVYDMIRTKYLNSLWIKVVRYTNNRVYNQLDWVKQAILVEISNREKELTTM